MTEDTPLEVGLLCYPKLTLLDLIGPYEVLHRMTNSRAHLLWKDTAPVTTEGGVGVVPDLAFGDAPRLDVLVVPGGIGQQELMTDDEVLGFLRTQGETARYVASVCITGR